MALIEFDAKTDTGKVRDHNEDAISASAILNLWVVADGMGGHACGEVASAIVIDVINRSVSEGLKLPEAIYRAHQQVVLEASNNQAATGMGSTIVAMALADDRCTIAWVGDSRAYRLRDRRLELLTRDHSYLELLKDNGLSEIDAREHPQKNIITQAVGGSEINPDLLIDDSLPGDRYLLCSDGLNDELSDDEITQLLLSADDAKEVTRALIEQALAHGGRDNVSVIIIDVEPAQRKPVTWLSAKLDVLNDAIQESPQKVALIGGVITAILIGALLLLFR